MVDQPPRLVRESSTQIVQDYLDTLLAEVPSYVPDEPDDLPTEPAAAVVGTEAAPTEQDDNTSVTAVQEPDKSFPAATRSQPAVHSEGSPSCHISAKAQVTPAEAEPPSASQTTGVDDWRDSDFASLLFDVGGLKLAAPLRHLGGISPLAAPLQTVAGQADWFLGLVRWNGRNIKVVDTALLIMPERVAAVGVPDYENMVVLGDSDWALAAHDVSESVTLTPGDVRWHHGSARRPWLGGMLVKRLCALLDVDRLIQQLDAHNS